MAAAGIPTSIQYPNGTPWDMRYRMGGPNTYLNTTRAGFANAMPNANASPTPGFNSSAYMVSPGTAASNPDQASADLTRKQSAYFQARGRPLEDAALKDITDPLMPQKVADEAGANARAAVDATRGMEARMAGRFGIRLSTDQGRSDARNFGMQGALADVGARTTAYNATEDNQVQLAQSALQIGRNISGQATQGLSTAGSLAVGRQQAAKEAAAARGASRTSSMLTGAGLGLGFATAAGAGAAASAGAAGLGAGIGLLAAFL